MGLGVRIRILSNHELEGIDVLRRPRVTQREVTAERPRAIELDSGRVSIDALQAVGVQRAVSDVWTVRRIFRIGSENAVNRSAGGRVASQRCALLGQRHQHVSVDVAANLVLRGAQRECSERAGGGAEIDAVEVLAGRLDRAYLEKGAGREDAVVVAPERIAVKPRPAGGRGMHRRRRRLAVLGAEIAAIHGELRNDRGGRAQADVEFLQRVVIHQIELDVLVAPALACFGGGLAEQVHVGAIRPRNGLRLACFALWLGRGGIRNLLCRLACRRGKREDKRRNDRDGPKAALPRGRHGGIPCYQRTLQPGEQRRRAAPRNSAQNTRTTPPSAR